MSELRNFTLLNEVTPGQASVQSVQSLMLMRCLDIQRTVKIISDFKLEITIEACGSCDECCVRRNRIVRLLSPHTA